MARRISGAHLSVWPGLFFVVEAGQFGCIGQSRKTRLELFATEEDARSALTVIEVAKRRRGYWLRPETP